MKHPFKLTFLALLITANLAQPLAYAVSDGVTVSSPQKICRDSLKTLLDLRNKKITDGEHVAKLEDYLDEVEDFFDLEGPSLSNKLKHLAPLFDNGIVHQAVAEALRAEGQNTSAKMQDAIALFKSMNSTEAQIRFLDAVIDQLFLVVHDNVDMTADNLATIRTLAKRYDMSINEYGTFVNAWRTHADSDYVLIKLAILENLLGENTGFAKKVGSYGAPKQRFFQFIEKVKGNTAAKNALLAPVPELISDEQLIFEQKSAFSDEVLTKFMARASLASRQRFIARHFLQMNLKQIDGLLTNTEILASLPHELGQNVKTYRDQMSERFVPFHELQMQIEKAQETLNLENLELNKNASGNNTAEGAGVTPDLMEKLIEYASSWSRPGTSSDNVHFTFHTLFDKYGDQMTNPQFMQLVLIYLNATEGYAPDYIPPILQRVYDYAMTRRLLPEQVQILKDKIDARIKSKGNASDQWDKARELLNLPWHEQTPQVVTLEEAEQRTREKQKQRAKVEQIQRSIKNLEQQKREIFTQEIEPFLKQWRANQGA